jgi:hypothetical protein
VKDRLTCLADNIFERKSLIERDCTLPVKWKLGRIFNEDYAVQVAIQQVPFR